MKRTIVRQNGAGVMVVAPTAGDKPLLWDISSALELVAQLREENCESMILPRELICPEFFDLSTTLAGQVLQKYSNYQVRLAIVGDFSDASKSLRDFIYESNRGRNFFFLPTADQALQRLAQR